MLVKPVLITAVLLLLGSCADTGYNRSYIISDTHQDEGTPEPSSQDCR